MRALITIPFFITLFFAQTALFAEKMKVGYPYLCNGVVAALRDEGLERRDLQLATSQAARPGLDDVVAVIDNITSGRLFVVGQGRSGRSEIIWRAADLQGKFTSIRWLSESFLVASTNDGQVIAFEGFGQSYPGTFSHRRVLFNGKNSPIILSPLIRGKIIAVQYLDFKLVEEGKVKELKRHGVFHWRATVIDPVERKSKNFDFTVISRPVFSSTEKFSIPNRPIPMALVRFDVQGDELRIGKEISGVFTPFASLRLSSLLEE